MKSFRSIASCLAVLCSTWNFFAASLLDQTFQLDPRVQGRIEVIRPQPDGRILVGGKFVNLPGISTANVVRLLENGSLDPTFRAVRLDAQVTEYSSIDITSSLDGRLLVSVGNYVPPPANAPLLSTKITSRSDVLSISSDGSGLHPV